MNIVLILGFILVALAPLVYLLVYKDIIEFNRKYGPVYGRTYWNMTVRIATDLLKSYEDDMDRIFQSQSEFSRYLEKFEKYGHSIDQIHEVMGNTDVCIRQDVRYGNDRQYAAVGKSANRYMWRRFGYRNLVLINLGIIDQKELNPKTIASLVMHELLHQYLEERYGDPWGGEKYDPSNPQFPEHTHPIWKQIGV